MSLLTVIGISKSINGTEVLKDISFSFQPFQRLAIAGATGSGKTTLLKIIAGLVKPDAGEVLFEGSRLLGPDEKLIPGHAGVGWLSQHFELRNNYRVEEILSYANKLTLTQAEAIFDICRVTHLLKRRTDQLSGGEKQRIAITRLLITSPRLLLLDEPFSNLDMFHKQLMKSVIDDISETLKITCVLVSHDPLDTLSWANDMLVMNKGAIVQRGTPQEIYHNPVDEYTAALFGSYSVVTGDMLRLLTADKNSPSTHQPLIIRPENFSLSTHGNHAIKGEIKKILYFGGYYEIEVLVNGSIIKARAVHTSFSTGEEMYVSLNANT